MIDKLNELEFLRMIVLIVSLTVLFDLPAGNGGTAS